MTAINYSKPSLIGIDVKSSYGDLYSFLNLTVNMFISRGGFNMRVNGGSLIGSLIIGHSSEQDHIYKWMLASTTKLIIQVVKPQVHPRP